MFLLLTALSAHCHATRSSLGIDAERSGTFHLKVLLLYHSVICDYTLK